MSLQEIQMIADKVIKHLKEAGFKIQRYDSITTRSIYLKVEI